MAYTVGQPVRVLDANRHNLRRAEAYTGNNGRLARLVVVFVGLDGRDTTERSWRYGARGCPSRLHAEVVTACVPRILGHRPRGAETSSVISVDYKRLVTHTGFLSTVSVRHL